MLSGILGLYIQCMIHNLPWTQNPYEQICKIVHIVSFSYVSMYLLAHSIYVAVCRKSGSGTCNVPCRGTFDKYIWPLWHFIFETNGMDAVVLHRLVSIFCFNHFNNYRSFLRVTLMFYERDLVATDLQSHLLRNACYCIIQMFFRFYFRSVLTSFDLEIAFFHIAA